MVVVVRFQGDGDYVVTSGDGECNGGGRGGDGGGTVRWRTCFAVPTLAVSSSLPSTEQCLATAARADSMPVGGEGERVDQGMGGSGVEVWRRERWRGVLVGQCMGV